MKLVRRNLLPSNAYFAVDHVRLVESILGDLKVMQGSLPCQVPARLDALLTETVKNWD